MKIKMAIACLCGIMVLGACGNQEDTKVSDSSTAPVTQTTDETIEKPEAKEEVKENKIERFSLGDTLVTSSEDGTNLYEITFNKAFLTEERNQFSDKTPDNVVVLEYTYKNLNIEDGLYISEGNDFRVYDANGNALSTYPAGADMYGGTVSVGRSGTSQEALGFDGDAHQTLEIEIYGSHFDTKPLAIVEVQPE